MCTFHRSNARGGYEHNKTRPKHKIQDMSADKNVTVLYVNSQRQVFFLPGLRCHSVQPSPLLHLAENFGQNHLDYHCTVQVMHRHTPFWPSTRQAHLSTAVISQLLFF